MPETFICSAEIREAETGPMLHGVLIQEGRAAQGGRAESFAPLSVVWPSTGIALLAEHRGAALAHAVPVRDADGSLRIETPATQPIIEAYATRKFFSVEFHAISEVRTKGGVREITRCLVEAAAMVTEPEYVQSTAEVRQSKRLRVWL